MKIDSLVSNQYFQTTQIAIDAFDLTADKTLYQKNETLLLKPGSNLKILTTAAALKFLGADYKFKTQLRYTGEILNGTLYGDLFVVGGCDPDFTTHDLDSLVFTLKQAGIKDITGNLYGDVSMMDSLFWGKGWMWDDDPSPDAPYLTPLCINKNYIGVIVKPADLYNKPNVQILPSSNYFKIENEALTVPADSPQTISVTRDWLERKNTLIIKGNIKNEIIADSLTDTIRVNIYKPELFFLSMMKEALKKNGIVLEGDSKISSAPDFAQGFSSIERKLKDIIPDLNKTSYNLGAEMILYAMAANFFGKPAHAENGVKMIDSLISLSGLNPSSYRIVDGSGVSHYNLVSAELIISILKYIYLREPEVYKLIYSSLPIAGIDGTLKERMTGTNAYSNVHAKTGTLSGTSCLSGYLHNSAGHLIAFSILIQNYAGSSKTARDIEDEICNILISY